MDAWGDIEMWVTSLRAAGRPETTCGLRAYHLRRIARELAVPSPWLVSGAQLVEWFGSHTWARETRRSWRSSARSFWGWGMRSGRTSVNPALDLDSVRAAEPMPRPAPDRVFKRAVLAADPREMLMVRLAAEAGLRRGEVAQVHARDLVEDLAGWSLSVHGKGGRPRLVPLTDELAAAVRRATARTGGFAFPGQVDGHLSPAWVGRLVSRLMPEAWTMHTLRHRFATRAFAVDRDLITVQQLLGHSSPATTQRYVRPPDDALRRTVREVAG